MVTLGKWSPYPGDVSKAVHVCNMWSARFLPVHLEGNSLIYGSDLLEVYFESTLHCPL